MRLERSIPVLAGFVAVGAAALWLHAAVLPFSRPFWGLFDNHLDLDVYRAGAQVVLDGGNVYSVSLLGIMQFTYAPVSMALFVPMALMPAQAAHIVWSAGILVALYLVIVLGFRSLGHDVTWRLRGVAAGCVAAATLVEPVRTTIWFGQINVLLLLVICADLLRPEGARLRGVGVGVAAGIKLTPLLFALYCLLLRQWRTAAGALGAFAVTVAVGFAAVPTASWTFWTDALFDSSRVALPNASDNQSVRGAVANLAGTDRPNLALWACLAVAVGALGMTAAVLAHRRGQELLAVSLVGMTSCAVSPMAWSHHWVWLVPLLMVLIHHAVEPGRHRLAAAVGAVAVMLVAFPWPTHLSDPIWYANRDLAESYRTGLFFVDVDGPLRWLTVAPYPLLLVVAAVTTIIVCRASSAGEAIGVGVGGRR